MATTQKDIANKLKMSRSLIAGVLTNQPSVWASEETRKLIKQTAKEMNYRPNASARSLRTGKTRTIALVYATSNHVHNHSFRDAGERIAERLGEYGYQLLVSVHASTESMSAYIENLAASSKADAVILWDNFGGDVDYEELGRLLESLEIPFVFKGRFEDSHPNWYQVDYNHQELMATATSYLASLGHRRIAYLGAADAYRYTDWMLEGYLSEMQRLFGEPVDSALIARGSVDEMPWPCSQTQKWMSCSPEQQPTAIVMAGTNSTWLGVERALNQAGLQAGLNSGEVGLAGMVWSGTPLQHGAGMGFDNVTLFRVADDLIDKILMPLLGGQEPPRVIHVPAMLRPVSHMKLTEFYKAMLHEIEEHQVKEEKWYEKATN